MALVGTRIDASGHGSQSALSLNVSSDAGHGHRFRVNQSGKVVGVRWRQHVSEYGQFYGRIRDASGVTLRSGSVTMEAAPSSWYEIALDSPLDLTAGVDYQVLVTASNVSATHVAPSGTEHTHTADNTTVTLLPGWINNGGVITSGAPEVMVGLVYQPRLTPYVPAIML